MYKHNKKNIAVAIKGVAEFFKKKKFTNMIESHQ